MFEINKVYDFKSHDNLLSPVFITSPHSGRIYPTDKIQQKTRIRKIEDIKPFLAKEIRQTESIIFAHSVLPHQKDIDNVLNVLKIDKDITIKNLLSETGISKSEIYKAITWLLKFGYIEVKG